jgi:ParB family transcriptional regulator, chromosome partitioning protein
MNDLNPIEPLEIEQLDLRYAHTRIRRPEALLPLMRSLEKWGQLRPVSVVRSEPPCHVLVDGYLRVEALRRCGKDIVLAEVWCCGEMEALLQVLIREQERRWEALEEASLIRELHDRHQLSQDSIARLLGKDKSWVCRRLSLLSALPDETLEAVRSGHLSTWAAGRILAPLARANPEHAKALTRTLSQEHLSTRELWDLFSYYQKANRKQRERMVLDPVLFLKALRAKEDESRIHSLKDGPEGRWLRDMKVAGHILVRLEKALPLVIYPGQGNLDRRLLLTAFEDTRSALLSLEKLIQEVSAS